MRFGMALLNVALASAIALGGEAGGLPATYLRAKEVKRGMKGYGLSVFRGTTVRRFDVEVLGVLRNAFPKQDMILARMSGAGLEKTGIIAGMSGSPIYLEVGKEHKLAGAIAYGWWYPKEPVCGITPFENMYAVVDASVPEKKGAGGPAKAAGQLDAPLTLSGRTFRSVRLSSRAPSWERMSGDAATLYRLRTPLYISGMTEPALALLRREFEPRGFLPVQGGAAGAAEAKGAKIEPGAALALRLAEGDIEIDGVGTCTEVIGNTVIAFGHPMFAEGRVSVPMATAVVHYTYPSLMRSFKLASSVETVGRLRADMQAAVVGTLGEFARMIPVEAKLRRADVRGEHTYRCRVFDHPRLTPRLIGYFLFNSLLIHGDFPRKNTIRFRATIDLAGHKPLVIENVYSGLSSYSTLFDAVYDVIGRVGTLSSNPFGKVNVKGVRADLEVLAKETTARVESIRLERNDYRPAETLRVLATLRPYEKEPIVQRLELKVPSDMPPGAASVTVCDAAASRRIDRSEAPHRYVPRSLEQVVDLLREQAPARRLYIRMRLPDRGAVIRGVELPSLPSSLLPVVASPKTTGVTSTRRSVKAHVDTAFVVSGSHTLPVLIRAREAP